VPSGAHTVLTNSFSPHFEHGMQGVAKRVQCRPRNSPCQLKGLSTRRRSQVLNRCSNAPY
jgi:hypothetical protein